MGDIHAELYDSPLLIHLLEAGQWDVAEQRLKRIFDRLQSGEETAKAHYYEAYHLICLSFAYAVRLHGGDPDLVWGDDPETAPRPPVATAAWKNWVFGTLNKLRELHSTGSSRRDVIEDVQRIVRQRLHEDVSLAQLSAKVHLHPKYLSWLYKQETGEGLSEYVYRLKMERAAEWLKNSRKKVYEIANHLGYQNTSHFIRVFKEKYQMTPNQYRMKYALAPGLRDKRSARVTEQDELYKGG